MFNFHKKVKQFPYRRFSKLFRRHSQFRILCQFVIFWGIAVLADYYFNYRIIFVVFRRIWTQEIHIDLSKNYFLSADQLSNGKFVVDTDKCRIPDVNVWSPSDYDYYYKKASPFECKCNKVNLTYVKGQSIIFNEDVLPELGYEHFTDISCCYETIFRVDQSEENFNRQADNHFNYSQACYPMGKETKPKSSFIHVICKNVSYSWTKTVYTNFHVVANFPSDDKVLAKKLEYWKKCENDNTGNNTCKWKTGKKRPPNVLLIGIDSTSRLNFRRHMPHSKILLEKELGAIEMNGYTKVGENTFPNFVPLMTSYSEQELTKICYENRWVPQDSCPYIWKEFSKRNYLTAHLEDSPELAIFNFMKTAFIRKPVDMYLRPFMMAAYESPYKLYCIGYQRPEEIILNYIIDLANLSESQGIPYFITTWLTDLTHGGYNDLQHLDMILTKSLLTLQREGLLDNTLLLVLGDHGYRFSDVRVTASGWYEDKLPALFIKLPNSVMTEYSQWNDALKYNSRQLTTPFDVHSTIKQILNKIPVAANMTTQSVPKTPLTNVPQSNPLRGLSLLDNLPDRSCEEAGIPKEYCACTPPVAFNKNLTLIQVAAEAVVQNINSELPSTCVQLKVASVIAAATLNYSNSTDFLVSLITDPGNFRYEALVQFDDVTGKFIRVNNILRTDKSTRFATCLTHKEAAYDLKCYCRKSIFST